MFKTKSPKFLAPRRGRGGEHCKESQFRGCALILILAQTHYLCGKPLPTLMFFSLACRCPVPGAGPHPCGTQEDLCGVSLQRLLLLTLPNAPLPGAHPGPARGYGFLPLNVSQPMEYERRLDPRGSTSLFVTFADLKLGMIYFFSWIFSFILL